ncbi:MAG: hypothetical protein U0325_18635 [Polyangiales bacterium]
MPQPPQCIRSVCGFTSQPLAASRSQSAKGAVHAPTAQVPLRHAGAPLGTRQAAPQAPQWAVFSCGFTQPPPQQVCPAGQGCDEEHPATQVAPTQRLPAGQWASTTHSTHRRDPTSQRPPVTPASAAGIAQSRSSRQPGAHWSRAAQNEPVGQRSRVGRHRTQRPDIVSHTGPEGEAAHASSVVQPVGTSGVSGGATTSGRSVGAGTSGASSDDPSAARASVGAPPASRPPTTDWFSPQAARSTASSTRRSMRALIP